MKTVQTATWWADLTAELNTIRLEDIEQPKEKILESQHVRVGVIRDESIKKMFGLVQQKSALLKELSAEEMRILADLIEFEGRLDHKEARERAAKDSLKLEQVRERFFALKNVTDALSDLFWASIRQSFPEIAMKQEIALCESWEVVWIKQDMDPVAKALIDFFNHDVLESLDESNRN